MMKIKTTNYLFICLMSLLLLNSSCQKKEKFRVGNIDENLSLKFDCDDSNFQPVHFDLIHGFGILAQRTDAENGKDKFSFRLKEREDCDRFTITKAKYLTFNPCMDNSGNRVHHIELEIIKQKSDGDNTVDSLDQLIELSRYDVIDIHISGYSPIASDSIPTMCPTSFDKPVFGNGVCKAIVIGSN